MLENVDIDTLASSSLWAKFVALVSALICYDKSGVAPVTDLYVTNVHVLRQMIYDRYPIVLQSLIGFSNEVERMAVNVRKLLTFNRYTEQHLVSPSEILPRNSSYPEHLAGGEQYQYPLRVVILFIMTYLL